MSYVSVMNTGAPRERHVMVIMLSSLVLGMAAFAQSLFLSEGEAYVMLYGVELMLSFCFIMGSTLWIDRALINPYLFLMATSVLFIGGRFIAYPIISADVFSDYNFVPLVLSASESARLAGSVLGGMLMIHAGYCFVRWKEVKGDLTMPKHQALPDFTLPAFVLLVLSAAASIYGIYNHYLACSQLGYMSIYQDQQSDNLTRLASLGQYGLLLATGLAFATHRKWLQLLGFSLVTAYFIAYLGLGLRSGFLALMLMATWVVHTRFKRLNIITVVMLPVVMVALAQLSITVGCRAQSIAAADSAAAAALTQTANNSEVPEIVAPEATASEKVEALKQATAGLPKTVGPETIAMPESFEQPSIGHGHPTNDQSFVKIFEQFKDRLHLEELAWFAYSQGTTFVYSGAAMRLDDYPWQAYAQSLMPGFSQIYGRLYPQVPVADYYFPHYLAKSLSEEKYDQGYGVGWSMFSDFHVYGGGYVFGYALVALIVGALLGYLFRAAETSAFYLGALVCVFLKIMLLPRSGIYSVVPYLIAYTILYGMIRFGYRITPIKLRKVIFWY